MNAAAVSAEPMLVTLAAGTTHTKCTLLHTDSPICPTYYVLFQVSKNFPAPIKQTPALMQS